MTRTILGLESSCDDTAAAVVRLDDSGANVLSSVVSGQNDLHADFGGVVPEIAARAHAEKLAPMIAEVMAEAEVELSDLDAIAALLSDPARTFDGHPDLKRILLPDDADFHALLKDFGRIEDAPEPATPEGA